MSDIDKMLGKWLFTPKGRIAQIVKIQIETESLALLVPTRKGVFELWLIRAAELEGFLLYETAAACKAAQVSPSLASGE